MHWLEAAAEEGAASIETFVQSNAGDGRGPTKHTANRIARGLCRHRGKAIPSPTALISLVGRIRRSEYYALCSVPFACPKSKNQVVDAQINELDPGFVPNNNQSSEPAISAFNVGILIN